MSISRKLADTLQRINELVSHREEAEKLALHQAIESEVDPSPFPGEYAPETTGKDAKSA